MRLTVSELENSNLDNMRYYTIHVWVDKTKRGTTLDTAYLDKVDAVFEMEKLIKSGRYEKIDIREEEVSKRRENTEVSTSGVVITYEKGEN